MTDKPGSVQPNPPGGHGRRGLLATLGGAGLVAAAGPAAGQTAAQPAPSPAASPAPGPRAPAGPSAAAVAAETRPPEHSEHFVERTGSDDMVDTLEALGIDYVAAMPGSSFRGLHESIINYGNNEKPELLTCLHEEISVSMAHGYAKIANKPMAVMLHGVVGIQHASMAIYNAWCDRVPVFMIGGNTLDATKRRPGAEWTHSAVDNAAIVRDFVKWDAQPTSIPGFAEAAMQGYALMMTPPFAPIMLMADTELQEQPVRRRVTLPRRQRLTVPMGDPALVAEAARSLVGAANPVIIADRLVRTQAGMDALVQLAELLQAPVIDKYNRLNMPTDHPLNQTARARTLVSGADVILGLDIVDFWNAVNDMRDIVDRVSERLHAESATLISIGTNDMLIHGNFQDSQRYQAFDINIPADAETTLPYLIEQIRRLLPADARNAIDDRGRAMRTAYEAIRARNLSDAANGWDSTPISTARMCAEIWALIRGNDYGLVGADSFFRSFWPQRLWAMNKSHQYAGNSGGYGIGYALPAAVGSALAHRPHGRITVNIQGDGDLMCNPGALWTAMHHKIPMLTVVHNNRAYHQETMHVQRMSNRHGRGVTRAGIGTGIDDPDIDYAKMAQSMGMAAFGPVTDPEALGPALRQAVDLVKRGESALVDVVSQGR